MAKTEPRKGFSGGNRGYFRVRGFEDLHIAVVITPKDKFQTPFMTKNRLITRASDYYYYAFFDQHYFYNLKLYPST